MEVWVWWASCIATIVAFQFLIGGKRTRVSTTSIAHRTDLHLQRKLQHALTGAMIYVASGFFSITAAVVILVCCALAFYGIHGLRKRNTRVNEMYLSHFHGLLRRNEINHSVLPGAFYFLVGCGVVLALFPTDLARLAILHLSVGDPSASLIGILYGRTRRAPTGKSLEGFLGCLAVSAGASLLSNCTPSSALFAGLCAATAESLELGYDDNLTLPVVSALLMTLGRYFVDFI